MKRAKQYWAMFWYGTNETICTRHKTLKAAKKHAKECEAIGGTKHHFLEVTKVR